MINEELAAYSARASPKTPHAPITGPRRLMVNLVTSDIAAALETLQGTIQDKLAFTAVYSALNTLAAIKHIAVYSDFSPIVGYHHRDGRLYKLLGDAMTADHLRGRPFTSSLVVSKQYGVPGDAYFEMARTLGVEVEDSYKGRVKFWLGQIKALEVKVPEWAQHQVQFWETGSWAPTPPVDV